ncbi:MAG: hypothetical protein Q9M43_01340 [Sulfurimonas sp.]|nr:hypothetical protein [Sulfurimonas sp.]
MDLGAIVCTPKNPSCELCPLTQSCIGKENPSLYHQKKSLVYEDKKLIFGVDVKDRCIAMVESKNMLELPSLESPLQDTHIGRYKHSVTRFRLQVDVYLCASDDENVKWIALDTIEKNALSSLTLKAINLYKKSVA